MRFKMRSALLALAVFANPTARAASGDWETFASTFGKGEGHSQTICLRARCHPN